MELCHSDFKNFLCKEHSTLAVPSHSTSAAHHGVLGLVVLLRARRVHGQPSHEFPDGLANTFSEFHCHLELCLSDMPSFSLSFHGCQTCIVTWLSLPMVSPCPSITNAMLNTSHTSYSALVFVSWRNSTDMEDRLHSFEKETDIQNWCVFWYVFLFVTIQSDGKKKMMILLSVTNSCWFMFTSLGLIPHLVSYSFIPSKVLKAWVPFEQLWNLRMCLWQKCWIGCDHHFLLNPNHFVESHSLQLQIWPGKAHLGRSVLDIHKHRCTYGCTRYLWT